MNPAEHAAWLALTAECPRTVEIVPHVAGYCRHYDDAGRVLCVRPGEVVPAGLNVTRAQARAWEAQRQANVAEMQ